MLFRIGTSAAVGRITLHDSAVHLLHQPFYQCRIEVIVISGFAGGKASPPLFPVAFRPSASYTFIRLSGLISLSYTLWPVLFPTVSHKQVPCPFTPEAHRERPAHAQTANKNKRFMTLYFKKLILHSIPPLLQSSDTRLPASCPQPAYGRSPTVRPNGGVPTRIWNGAP